ncbi:MAG TPA: VWA domain-containing protein [Candidatus Acidoferrum sp.]|nr:VWA domain-containing protein [Candidatus Acidoferrum sp.]
MRSLLKLAALCGVSVFATALTPRAFSQEPTAQAPTIKTQVNLVNLFVTVRDKGKHIVTNLTQNDFKVYEDGQEQKIAFFSKEVTLPITLGLLLDTSGSEQYMLGAIQDGATSFLNRVMRKGDEAMVISFDLDVDLLADITEDRSILSRAIHRARINAAGPVVTPGTLPTGNIGTDFYDALYLACHDELASEAGRKAVVVLTDAEDNGSKVKVQDAIEAAQRTDTVVHILLVYDPHYGADSGIAKKITDDTGGRMIVVNNEKHLLEAFDQISEELRSQYTLGYYPTNSAHDGAFRKIKVEVSDHGDKVLTRKGYYAPKN